ncbi:uncharacterized protein LOC110269426 [Arachis ipaensis]|uniref:uncharacterized protein LOC110269426 n=1 Tax=Arachis ipaensis TaxID=130454 RepID=UPI000A2AFE9B|nr:uncharacterized protein LOC110269426 [Arachis ipaensis]
MLMCHVLIGVFIKPPSPFTLTVSSLNITFSLKLSSLISIIVAQWLSHKLSPSLDSGLSTISSVALKLVVSHHRLALSCPRAPFLSQQVPGLIIVVAPCLVTVSHSIPRLCCLCCACRRRRQKQQVPGLIVVVVFLLPLSPSTSSSLSASSPPSASFPEAGLRFACAFESNEKICQRNLPTKVKVAAAPKRLKIPHVHYCNTGKQL